MYLIEVPDTQGAKDLATVARVVGELAELAVHKDDLIVGVGGEVICDIAGFVASTYNRGMPLALVPTTLAAQADSAVGGKASLNLPQGRNLLGIVHQPVAVVTDVTAAAGQPGREYRAGLAEVVKHALISGGDLVAAAQRARRRAGAAVTWTPLGRGGRPQRPGQGGHREQRRARAGRPPVPELRAHLRPRHRAGQRAGHGRRRLGGRGRHDGRRLPGPAAGPDRRRPGGPAPASCWAGLGLPVTGQFDLGGLREAWLRDKKYQDGARFVVLNGLGRPEAGVPADDDSLAASWRPGRQPAQLASA